MCIFFMNIEKKYRHTFYSFERGKDVTLAYFKSSADERKALVFRNNSRHWKEIEGQVEKWVRENWEKWMDEEPEWLSENIKAGIPAHMIPNIQDRKDVQELQRQRRRSSVAERVAGMRRSSLLGAEKVTPE